MSARPRSFTRRENARMCVLGGFVLAACAAPFFLMVGATALEARAWRGSVLTEGRVVRRLDYPWVVYTFTPEGGMPAQDIAELSRVARSRWDTVRPGHRMQIEYLPFNPGRRQYVLPTRGTYLAGSGRFAFALAITTVMGAVVLAGLSLAAAGAGMLVMMKIRGEGAGSEAA